ncbi:CI116 protein, partial [Struthidea cinerea]|nr:CI116 protein [Struthidea cinerea]
MSGPDQEVPRRFQELTFYRGYGRPPAHPRFRTTNQSYGSRAPTVHELPNSFNILSHKFSDHLGKIGMVRNESLNTSLEKSHCTGPDTLITAYEHLDFHPSYNPSGPSHCRDQPL